MTLLVISPDYASHLYPLATLATAWRDAGERVVVATGPATDALVQAFGYERAHLQLGRGSNPGVIRAEEQPSGEDDALRGFFDATRVGAVETLTFQARARRSDLLWDPVGVAREVERVVDAVAPDDVIVDHLAFGARLALSANGIRHADVVLGHPSALTVGDEVYGLPPAFPRRLQPSASELAGLRAVCEEVRDEFTEQWNTALAVLAPGAAASADAFAETGDVLLLNYPGALHPAERTRLLPAARLPRVGGAVRATGRRGRGVARGGRPPGGVRQPRELPLGAVRRAGVGGRGPARARRAGRPGARLHAAPALAPLPEGWLVREVLPQVTLLRHAGLAVSHGGNNSVTEALTAGVPMLLLPLSTDQFAGAAALEDAGLAEVLDPNALSHSEIREVRCTPAAVSRASRGTASPPSRPNWSTPRARPGPATALRDTLLIRDGVRP